MKDAFDPKETVKRAVIYCRVSSRKQASEGSGLESQEHRCREYAASKGYMVDAVFPDDVSGGGDFMKRPGMVALLAYLDAKPDEHYVVIFDDLKRYARDVEFHLKLRRIMAERGATRECLNFRFEDTPEGKFIETMLAAQGELEREQNGRQVIQKMKARIERGYWVFHAPIGYRYEKCRQGGKRLVPDEPAASVIREALEGYAVGRFETQVEVKRFLESQPLYHRGKDGLVHPSRVTELLERVVYAGYVEAPMWKVSLREGQHEGLITYQTYLRNQERLKQGSRVPARRDINADFPLRGYVLCDECHVPLRGGWSKGKKQHHPYYLCQNKNCNCYGKSIRRADMEGAFETMLRRLEPGHGLTDLLKTMVIDAWGQRMDQAKHIKAGVERELADLDKQIDILADRIVESQSSAAITAYERKIASLEKQKLEMRDRAVNHTQPKATLGQVLEHALGFVQNPWKLWQSGDLTIRKLVLRMVFAERLRYIRGIGYRTPKTTLPFKYLEQFHNVKMGVVEGNGPSPNPTQAADWPPGEARPIGGVRVADCREIWKMVGATGIEPVTPTMST